MKRLSVTAIVFFLACPVLAQSAKRVDALFVHQDSSGGFADAAFWQEVLRDYQIECRLVSQQDLSEASLLDVDVILVGAYSAERPEDKSVRWYKYWGDPHLVDLIVESELPVLGISMGALSLFGQMDTPVGGGRYAHGSEQTFTFAEHASKYLESPFPIEKMAEVELSTRKQAADGYYHPPSYIESILQNVTNPAYYAVVRYENYVVWGAGPDPGYLTEPGKRLFANIAHHLADSGH